MDDENYMRLAITEAKKAYADGEKKGIGAIIVKENVVIGIGHNNVKISRDPTAHAEINAIRDATKRLNIRSLNDCILYSTCEPCPMCFSAAWWARVSKIAYGASLVDLIDLGNRQINVSCNFLNRNGSYQLEILGGVLRDECLELCR